MNRILLFAISTLICLNTDAQILLAQYNFDNNTNDAIGTHHGTPLNGPVYTTDRFGNPNSAIFLDGIDDYINLANAATLQAPTYTYEAWVKASSNPVSQGFCYLSIGGNGGDQFMSNVSVGANVGWSISGYQAGGGTYNLFADGPTVLDQWYHVTGIRDVTVARIFVDGVQTDSAIIGAAVLPAYGSTLGYIGRRTPIGPVGPQFFHGAIDDLRIYSGVSIPLPLDLVSFTAIKENNAASLKWKTANMKNVAAFEIEKSSDALSFLKIGSVAATEKNDYNFTDPKLADANNYYRLKMIDEDGKFTFSKIVLLINTSKNDINIYPNPVTDELKITTTKPGFRYSIFDIYGNKLQSGDTETSQAVLKTDLGRGIYFIKVENAGTQKVIKFTKE